jgi:hypothetical protein
LTDSVDLPSGRVRVATHLAVRLASRLRDTMCGASAGISAWLALIHGFIRRRLRKRRMGALPKSAVAEACRSQPLASHVATLPCRWRWLIVAPNRDRRVFRALLLDHRE